MNSARDFTARLAELLRHERSAMADFLLALADFDARKLWRELGHASLFAFLRRELGLSAGAAQYRKTAAELLQRFPQLEAALRDGRLCLSSVIELAKVITAQNAAEVVPRFFGLSSRDAAQVAVSIRPVEEPPQRNVVTRLRPAAAELPAVVAAPSVPPSVAGETATHLFRAPETQSAASLRAPSPAPSAARAPMPSSMPAAAPSALAPEPSSTTRPLTAERSRPNSPCPAGSSRSSRRRPPPCRTPIPAQAWRRSSRLASTWSSRARQAKGARGKASEGGALRQLGVEPHSRAREARGLDARRRPLPVRNGGRKPLRLDLPGRVRPHPSARVGRPFHDRECAPDVQTP